VQEVELTLQPDFYATYCIIYRFKFSLLFTRIVIKKRYLLSNAIVLSLECKHSFKFSRKFDEEKMEKIKNNVGVSTHIFLQSLRDCYLLLALPK
jgi:hypothetical protein